MKVWSGMHKWLGALLAPMMFVWFLSGLGMLFFSFPKVGNQGIVHRDTIGGTLPSLRQILDQVPEGEELKNLQLTTFSGKSIIRLTTDQQTLQLVADTSFTPVVESSVSYSYILEQARRWSTYPIKEIKEMNRLDTWTPYSSLKEHFPIYRIKYSDPQNSYLYLSSRTGEALQYCTKEERIGGALSTIPHMLYFWQLRQNRDLWLAIVSILSGLCAIMCLAGIVVGIRYYWITWRKRRRLQSPYRKRSYRLHHIFGILFGFFSMMFALSGLLSMQELPDWIVKQHNPKLKSAVRKRDKVDFSGFSLDYRELLKQLGEVKEIEFEQFGTKTFYTVTYRDTVAKFDATSTSIQPLYLTKDEVLGRLSRFVDAPMSVELLEAYDNYYVSNIESETLPVYKVICNDPDKSHFYVTPTEGNIRYFNTNNRIKKWIYPAFHSLRIKYFAGHPMFRKVLITSLCIGGLVLSVTGMVLGFHFWTRLIRKSRLKQKSE
ncbi:MAG: PepSY domain-containing protein [Bacteroidales bacterium]|uniref:PepSY domain-containing protein n=1 Tax=Porphyromonas sp. TaxID=1924944 RepID=UPI00297B7358|nr:PepSY domain-containing protein [Porphyromonas sp.]MDD7438033.1 PepSY domain-containing protein [Bacteroidales bacterium]MDY3067815.1 PepSY domain-containing protein [Porphyromonas sp.]